MLRDRINDYYLNKDYNCAETMLRIINDEYGLGLTEEEFKLVSAFGAGMGCGNACGALCGCLAANGRLCVTGRAHATEGFNPMNAELVERFRQALGDTMCSELVKVHKKPDVRCLETVQLAADLYEQFYEDTLKARRNG